MRQLLQSFHMAWEIFLVMSAGFSDDVMWVLPNWEAITQCISFSIFFGINVNPGYADLTNLTTRLCVSLVVPSL